MAYQELFERIMLEPEHTELLEFVVEASRNTPREQREKFFVIRRTGGGDILICPGVNQDRQSIYLGDVEVLANAGLVALSQNSKRTPQFDVTPLGFRYYDYLKQQRGESSRRVEEEVHSYIDAYSFRDRYRLAYQRWNEAETRLWSSDSESELTTIGHLCREALQEFAHRLVENCGFTDSYPDKAKTVSRIRAVLRRRKPDISEKESAFLDAMLAYWGTVNDLVQRQEHGAQKEGSPLVWEDARRVVFQTIIVMYEIDRAI